MNEPMQDTAGGGGETSGWAAHVRAKAKEVAQAARKARDRELRLRFTHEVGKPDQKMPDTPRWDADLDKYERWARQIFEPLEQLADPSKARAIASRLNKVVGFPRSAKDHGIRLDKMDRSGLLAQGRERAQIDYFLRCWDGNAMLAFTSFYAKVPEAARHQTELGRALRNSMLLHAKVLECARHDTDETAHKAVASLQAVHPGGGFGLKTALTTLKAVRDLVNTVVQGLAARDVESLAATAFETGKGVYESDAGKRVHVPLGGHTVHQVLTNLSHAVGKVLESLDDGDRELARSLNKDIGHVDDNRHKYVVRRPRKFIDAKHLGPRFHHVA